MNYVQEPFDGVIPLNQIQGLGKRTKDEAEEITSDKTPAKKAASIVTSKQQNGLTMTGEPADQVIINPDLPRLKESADSTAVMAFGRFNPPTTGHEKLIHKVESTAKEHNGTAHIVASHSEGTSKNPLPQKAKLGYLQKVAGKDTNISGSSKTEPSIFHAASKLHAAGHKHLVVVAGSDRVKEYEDSLKKYNGVKGAHGHYNFKSIKVISAGHRDPDAEGSEGMSGTKMRALAKGGKKKEFKAGLPKALHPHADEIGNHIRSIKEETVEEAQKLSSLDKFRAAAAERERKHNEIDRKRKEAAAQGKENMSASIDSLAKRFEEVNMDEAFSLQQRLNRGQRMRRNKNKLRVARAVARKRLAKNKGMRRRALKRARTVVRQRIAGQRGLNYSKLNTSDKIAIDRMADRRKKQIIRMANRLAPRVKRDEIKRLAAVISGRRVTNSPTPQISSYQPIITSNIHNLTEKAAVALKQKSVKAGIDFNVVIEVFNQGVESYPSDTKLSVQQYAFSRVNSFLAKGKAYMEDRHLIDRKTIQYTARDMANTDIASLPKAHGLTKHQKIKVKNKNDSDVSRKKIESIRRAAGQVHTKIIENKILEDINTINKRIASRFSNQGKPAVANLYKNVARAAQQGPSSIEHAQRELKAKKQFFSPIQTQSKLQEAVQSAITRVSNRLTRSTSPQLNQVKKDIIKALKNKDYTSLADIIVYLARNKLEQQKRIKLENTCIPEEDYIYEEWTEKEWNILTEENNEGKTLNKPMRATSGPKKFIVYVKNDKGNIIKLGFGDPNLEIKRDDPVRRKSFRARHGCDNPGPKWKANWWSCNWSWSANKKVGA